MALVGLLFIAPFVVPVHRYPIPSFDVEWIAVVVLATALVVTALGTSARLSVQWPLPAIAALLLAIGGAQYLLGMLTYSYSLAALFMFMCALFAAYLLGRWLVSVELRDRALLAVSLALVAGGVLSLVVQLVQALDFRALPDWLVLPMGETLSKRRPYANIGQPNHLATYFALATIGALYLTRRGWQRACMLGLVAIFAIGLALTVSRMGTLFALGLIGLILTRSALGPESLRERVQFASAIVLGYAVGLVLTRILLVDPDGVTATALGRYGGTFLQRLSMWTDAVRIAAAHPWLGVGVGEYGGAQYWAALPTPALEATNNPHNIVLQIAAEFGWPAAALAVLIVVLWFRGRVQAWKRDPAVAAALAMILLVLAHAMLEYPLSHLHFLIAVALLAGVAEPPGTPAASTGLRTRRVLAPIGVAMICAALVMKIDYDSITPLWASYLDDIREGRGHQPETTLGIIASMRSTFFRPQMERLYVELIPPQAQQGDENLAMVGRVLTRLGDVRVIVRYIQLLLQEGRIEETYPHLARLRVFAGANYPMLRDEILQSIAANGVELDPLRRKLADP